MPHDPQDVQELFLRLVELPPADRPAALDRECGSDVALRQRIEGLLKAHEESDSLLDRPSDRFDATVLSEADNGANLEAAADVAGDRLPSGGSKRSCSPGTAETHIREESIAGAVIADRYTMVQQIGEGGMGEVWMAKQTSPVKRKVALKLIKMGMDSKAVLARFDQERQALALMDHPNIAKVLDGGITPTGQPFFVMELVNGLPLNKFCDEARLDTNGRLELFVAICQAVQHAHQKGIVHRDLKPANILVTLIDGRPVPKVIDFGVAKATSGKLTDESLSTQFGAVVGTLEYMSPEQAGFSGEDIDTRADIYSLGVILYELLTGLRPIDAQRLKKAALTEMIRIVREEEPSRPSTRLSTNASLPSMAALRQTDPKKLMALLRGELDWVVMKCLEKRRERRYETANALARDVQRYLADEAVEARPPNAGYRLRKFLKRNKGSVVAASLLMLAVGAGVIGTAFGLMRAEQRRQEAVQARQRQEVEAAARATAERARDEVATARETLAHVEYGRTIEVAHQEWQDDNVAAARALLESTRPDLRGWEWNYVHRLCHSDFLTLGGQAIQVNAASYSSDGLRIVTACDDKTVRIWNAQTGAEMFTLTGHTAHVSSATFSPNGLYVVTTSEDDTAKVWDAKAGAELFTLTGNTNAGLVSFSPDGSRIVTAGLDGTAKVWDTKTGSEVITFREHAGRIFSASFSPDGSRIVTAGDSDHTARIWDAQTGAVLFTLTGHTGVVSSASFNPNGSRVVTTGGSDHSTRIWDAQTGTELFTLRGHTGFVGPASFSPDGSRIVTAGNGDRTARVWDAQTGFELLTLTGHHGSVNAASFSPDGSLIVTAGNRDRTVRVWDAQSGSEVLVLRGHIHQVQSASFSPDGSRILSVDGANGIGDKFVDKTARIWDVRTDLELHTINEFTNFVGTASFSPDGSRIIVTDERTASLRDAATGAEVLKLEGHNLNERTFPPNYMESRTVSAAFSSDNSRIVTAGNWDKIARVWNASTGAEILTLKGQNDYIDWVSLSPDGSYIATSSRDSTKVWDTKTGALVREFAGSCASFGPDGSRIVTMGRNGESSTVWNASTGAKLVVLKGSNGVPSFSPNGVRIVAAGAMSMTPTVCDSENGAELLSLKGHTGPVYSAMYNPDGTRIITASTDGTAKIWDAETGVALLTLQGQSNPVFSASFSPDGSRIVAASSDQTVRIWDATPVNREFLRAATAID